MGESHEPIWKAFEEAHKTGIQPDLWEYWERDSVKSADCLCGLIQSDMRARLRKGERPWVSNYLHPRLWPHRRSVSMAISHMLFEDGGDLAQTLGVAAIGDLKTTKLLGFGAFGTVFEAQDGNKGLVAVKIAHPGDARADMLIKNEINVLGRVAQISKEQRGAVQELLRFGKDERWGPYIVTKAVNCETLSAKLKSNLLVSDRLDLSRQIITVVRRLHDHGIFHGDLSTDNFLVSTVNGSPCVHCIDFSGANTQYPEHDSPVVYSPEYAAPELLNGDVYHATYVSDTWSIGILLYEVLSGKHPYGELLESVSLKQWRHRIQSVPRERLSKEYPAKLSDLILECLCADPRRRLQRLDVLQAAIPSAVDTLSRSLGDERMAKATNADAVDTEYLLRSYFDVLVKKFGGVDVPLIDPKYPVGTIPIGSIAMDLPLVIERHVELRYDRERSATHWASEQLRNERQHRTNTSSNTSLGQRLKDRRGSVLVGQPGCGKSTLLAWAVYRWAVSHPVWRRTESWAESPINPHAPKIETLPLIPVVLICRDLSKMREDWTLHDLISTQLEQWQFTVSQKERLSDTLTEAIRNGQAIVFVDGLDELHQDTLRRAMCRLLTGALVTHSCKILATSRVVGFRVVEPELEAFDTLVVDSLDFSHHKAYVELWAMIAAHADVDSLRQRIQSPRIARLCENMLMLVLMTQLSSLKRDLPSRRVDVFDRLFTIMIERQREGKGDRVTRNELVPAIEHLAYQMCARDQSRLIDWDVVRDFQRAHELESVRDLALDGVRDANLLLQAILQRMELLNIVGVERVDGLDRKSIQFFHKSIQEYFAAQAIIHGRGGVDGTPIQRLEQVLQVPLQNKMIKNIGSGRKTEPVLAERWHEAISMAIASMDRDMADRAMRAVLASPSGDAADRRARAVLALRCLSEEPSVSEDTVQLVCASIAPAALREDGFNTDLNTLLDDAVVSATSTKHGASLQRTLISEYILRSSDSKVGRVLLTSLGSSQEACLCENNASAIVSVYSEHIRSANVETRVSALLELTNLFFGADGENGTASIAYLSDCIQPSLLPGLLECLGDANPAVASAAAWVLVWLLRAKDGNPKRGAKWLSRTQAERVEQAAGMHMNNPNVMWAIALILSCVEGYQPVKFQSPQFSDGRRSDPKDWIYQFAVMCDGGTPQRALLKPRSMSPISTISLLSKVIEIERESVALAAHRAAVSLGRFGVFPPQACKPLAKLVRDDLEHNDWRDEAAVYLALNASREATQELLSLFGEPHEPDDFVPVRAGFALVAQGDCDTLARLLVSDGAMVDQFRTAFAFGLAGIKDERGRQILESLKDHPSDNVRSAVDKALAKAADWAKKFPVVP